MTIDTKNRLLWRCVVVIDLSGIRICHELIEYMRVESVEESMKSVDIIKSYEFYDEIER